MEPLFNFLNAHWSDILLAAEFAGHLAKKKTLAYRIADALRPMPTQPPK